MRGDADVAAAAALLAEPTRAELVLAVMEAGALPATELAARAGIAASTASEHLARLLDGGFLVAVKDGRHRYYDLADPTVAAAVEALSVVAPRREIRSLGQATKSELIRQARTCYDHLAGGLGVALAKALECRRAIVRQDGTYAIGDHAADVLATLDLDLDLLARQRRPLVRGCLDWSEREPHVAGAVGAALLDVALDSGWVRRRRGTRALRLTPGGARALELQLGLDLG